MKIRKWDNIKRFTRAALAAALMTVSALAGITVFGIESTADSNAVMSGNYRNSNEITFNGKKYTLAFSDDFNYFDSGKWAYCPEQERQDAGGVWRDSCCSVNDGNLVISCGVNADGTPISGGIRSTGEYERIYGLYHIRFKAEKADGLWFAFWLLSDEMNDSTVGNGAADGAELDIFELVPHTGEFCMSVHWDGYGDDLKSSFETIYVDDDFYGRYHDVWYLWDEYGYRFYLDGTGEDDLVFDFPGKEYGDGTCAVPCDMIISAEFGSWGGEIDNTQLPMHFSIDSVKVYEEKKNDSEEKREQPDLVKPEYVQSETSAVTAVPDETSSSEDTSLPETSASETTTEPAETTVPETAAENTTETVVNETDTLAPVTSDSGDDENPHTGAALGGITLLTLAGAAILISKKRK